VKRSLIVLIIFVMLLAACSQPTAPATPTRVPLLPTAGSSSKPTLPPVGSKITLPATALTTAPSLPESTAEPVRPSSSTGAMLYHDDFSDPSSGWDVYTNDNGSAGYDNGAYVIRVKTDTFWLWSNAYQSFDDVSVETDAVLADGANDSDIGVICRYQSDNKNFMFAIITADGRYGIYEVKDGTDYLMTSDSLKRSDAIKTGQAVNHIQFICMGVEYTLVINGQPVDSVASKTLSSGDVGLIAGTGKTGNNEVRFDNFVVTTPSADLRPIAQPALSGSTLYQDDFSNPNSGWDVGETDNGSTGYHDGVFVIKVNNPKYAKWSNAYQTFENAAIEVDVVLAQGPASGELGLICRYQSDDQNFIYATISPDGFYGIYDSKDGTDTVLTGNGKLAQTDAIKPGNATNHIQFICNGDQYTLRINGQLVDAVTNSRLSSGDVGLIAATGDEGGLEAHFDNFLVTAP
jgi:hypothetical protein